MSESGSRPAPTYLVLGEVLRPHGVRGELRMRVLTSYPERIAELQQVYLGSDPTSSDIRQFMVQHIRMHHDYGLLKLAGIDDRNSAELLRALMVMVHIDDAVPLEDDEVYLFQLIDMQIQTEDGLTLGHITDVLETGANDVYVVQGDRYGEILIPVTDETIVQTDVENRQITVRLPEGLLPDDNSGLLDN